MSNRYRDSMDRLHFTQGRKQEMVDRLMEAGPVPPVRRPLWFHRFTAAGVTAALALSLEMARATDTLDSTGDAFAGLFGGGPAETEIVDQVSYPIGVSATSNGVTITADAVMGDTYSYAIVYSICQDDGSPLAGDETLAAGIKRDGLLPLRFRNYDTRVRTSGGGAHGSPWFYDTDPANDAIQFVKMMTQDQPFRLGTASVKFQDLSVYTGSDYRTSETLAKGAWRLKFDFAFKDSSISLPAGQSFVLNDMGATLNGVTFSPLSIQVDYTTHQGLVWSENRENGQEDEYDRGQSYRYFELLPVVIICTDGTTQDLANTSGGITPGDGETVCQKSRIFDELRPLNEVAFVTVGDIVLPVSTG